MKLKRCSFCNKEVLKLWYSKPPCCNNWSCKQKYNEEENIRSGTNEKSNIPNNSSTFGSKSSSKRDVEVENNWGPSRNSSFGKKARKTTGELKLFLKIYAERNGLCEITGEPIQFSPSCFAHILAKGAYPGYRLNPENIIMVKTRIHELYDNSSKERLLQEFPEAKVIYEMKDKLRYEYYNGDQNKNQ